MAWFTEKETYKAIDLLNYWLIDLLTWFLTRGRVAVAGRETSKFLALLTFWPTVLLTYWPIDLLTWFLTRGRVDETGRETLVRRGAPGDAVAHVVWVDWGVGDVVLSSAEPPQSNVSHVHVFFVVASDWPVPRHKVDNCTRIRRTFTTIYCRYKNEY